MTDEQKRKLAFLQTAYLEGIAKSKEAGTVTARDNAITAHMNRFRETDEEVREAFTLWQVRHANIGEVTIEWPDGRETKKSFTEH